MPRSQFFFYSALFNSWKSDKGAAESKIHTTKNTTYSKMFGHHRRWNRKKIKPTGLRNVAISEKKIKISGQTPVFFFYFFLLYDLWHVYDSPRLPVSMPGHSGDTWPGSASSSARRPRTCTVVALRELWGEQAEKEIRGNRAKLPLNSRKE